MCLEKGSESSDQLCVYSVELIDSVYSVIKNELSELSFKAYFPLFYSYSPRFFSDTHCIVANKNTEAFEA